MTRSTGSLPRSPRARSTHVRLGAVAAVAAVAVVAGSLTSPAAAARGERPCDPNNYLSSDIPQASLTRGAQVASGDIPGHGGAGGSSSVIKTVVWRWDGSSLDRLCGDFGNGRFDGATFGVIVDPNYVITPEFRAALAAVRERVKYVPPFIVIPYPGPRATGLPLVYITGRQQQ